MIQWGIIGAGNVTEVKSGPAFNKIMNSSLMAVMRRDEEKVRDYARRHDVPKWYTDADGLINDPDVNAVYIATPPSSHKEYTLKVLQAGKPVYVEKPMAMTYKECLEMNDTAQYYGQKLFVAYYRRALPYFLKVKELLESGIIGKILTVDIVYYCPPFETDLNPDLHTWRIQQEIGGNGYFYDLAPHTLDILDFLLGEISEAKGFGTNRAGFYTVDDTVSATFRFQSGVLGTGRWCFATSEDSVTDNVVITGSKGEIVFNTFQFNPIELKAGLATQYFSYDRPLHIQFPLIQTIVDELLGKGKCPSTGISAARTSRVMDLILNNL